MAPVFTYYQLVKPHACDTMSIEETKRFWRVRQCEEDEDEGKKDISEADLSLMRSWYYVDDEWYQNCYKRSCTTTLPRKKDMDKKDDCNPTEDVSDDAAVVADDTSFHYVDVDLYTCNHLPKRGYDSEEGDTIEVHRYGDDAEGYRTFTSSTFELGKLYDVKNLGYTYCSRLRESTALDDFPVCPGGGLYTGPILEFLTTQLALKDYYPLKKSGISFDASTMFARG